VGTRQSGPALVGLGVSRATVPSRAYFLPGAAQGSPEVSFCCETGVYGSFDLDMDVDLDVDVVDCIGSAVENKTFEQIQPRVPQ